MVMDHPGGSEPDTLMFSHVNRLSITYLTQNVIRLQRERRTDIKTELAIKLDGLYRQLPLCLSRISSLYRLLALSTSLVKI